MSGNASWKKRLFSWGLAIAACAFIAYVVPLRDKCVGEGADLRCEPGLLSTLSHAKVGMLVPLLLLYVLGSFLWAVRWRMLLILAGMRISVWSVWRVTLQAQAGGILLPGGIGGDALRVAWMIGRGARSSIVVASVLLDRALGLLTVASIAAAFGLSSAGAAGSRVTQAAITLCAIPVGFVVGLLVLRSKYVAEHHLIDPEAKGVRGKVSRAVQPVLAYLGDPKAPRAIFLGVLVSLVVSAVQLAVIRGIVASLGGVPTEEKWIYVGTAMAFIVAIIPALPGGWGTADAAYVVFLGQAGLPRALILGMSLLYRLFWYSTGFVGAVLYLLPGGRQRPKEVVAPPP